MILVWISNMQGCFKDGAAASSWRKPGAGETTCRVRYSCFVAKLTSQSSISHHFHLRAIITFFNLCGLRVLCGCIFSQPERKELRTRVELRHRLTLINTATELSVENGLNPCKAASERRRSDEAGRMSHWFDLFCVFCLLSTDYWPSASQFSVNTARSRKLTLASSLISAAEYLRRYG